MLLQLFFRLDFLNSMWNTVISECNIMHILKDVIYSSGYVTTLKNHFRENIFENIFCRRMRKSPVLVELHLQLSAKKGSFLDHLENNTIEFE